MSSAYSKQLSFSSRTFSPKPFIFRRTANSSVYRPNSKGDRVQPCLTPLTLLTCPQEIHAASLKDEVMKVILCFVLVAVASSAASPMFGASGMMKRRFPGASDMTVRTYREITNSNAGRTGNSASSATPVSPAVVRVGPAEQDQSWMFSNSRPSQLAAQPAPQLPSRPVPAPVSNMQIDNLQQGENSLDDFQYYPHYPTNPNDPSFSDYYDEVSFDDYFGAGYKNYPKPIVMPKRHYY
ncbi:hypothetical protein FHG87_005323 [Trinorchestia longiramus]|nr:hypothetical protein FHG87_005323 [Trinorchestia longiramus]